MKNLPSDRNLKIQIQMFRVTCFNCILLDDGDFKTLHSSELVFQINIWILPLWWVTYTRIQWNPKRIIHKEWKKKFYKSSSLPVFAQSSFLLTLEHRSSLSSHPAAFVLFRFLVFVSLIFASRTLVRSLPCFNWLL